MSIYFSDDARANVVGNAGGSEIASVPLVRARKRRNRWDDRVL
jgi:hypothetical protein